MKMRCKSGYMRHWFTVRGQVGDKTDYCVRCGKPKKTSKEAAYRD